eukprot:879804-Pelagomonas_calceolata.AAC.5
MALDCCPVFFALEGSTCACSQITRKQSSGLLPFLATLAQQKHLPPDVSQACLINVGSRSWLLYIGSVPSQKQHIQAHSLAAAAAAAATG